mmetsp:Transcript_4754/g.7024  ORF Transcript_4754/g.7024 Transcript_4754/m.7024 type:complete len:231 (-) Transcript_4754:27-719(-)
MLVWAVSVLTCVPVSGALAAMPVGRSSSFSSSSIRARLLAFWFSAKKKPLSFKISLSHHLDDNGCGAGCGAEVRGSISAFSSPFMDGTVDTGAIDEPPKPSSFLLFVNTVEASRHCSHCIVSSSLTLYKPSFSSDAVLTRRPLTASLPLRPARTILRSFSRGIPSKKSRAAISRVAQVDDDPPGAVDRYTRALALGCGGVRDGVNCTPLLLPVVLTTMVAAGAVIIVTIG